MGVHGLWDLLAPVGRRVSVETLSGKRLAIDASIWMVQFMKAMRDERGEMVRNAHLIGFFRRICKLLFLRTKPVFVFDGGTPALKRRTVIARRRQRENAQAKIRKTAEKLLLNHVRSMRVKELANNLQHQKDSNNSKGKEVLLDESDTMKKKEAVSEGYNQEKIDKMLAASILAEESGEFGTESSCAAEIGSSSGNAPASTSAFQIEDENEEDDEEMILPVTGGNVDPAVLAALPPSMQLDLLAQMRERLMAENRQKYQKVKKAPQKFSELQIEAYLKTVAFRREIDQVQKAAAGKGVGGVQTSRIASESNREFIFSSSFSGDKQLLASGGAEKLPVKQPIIEYKSSSFDILNVLASSAKSNREAEPAVDEAVETFTDERGRKRVSSRRHLGIRMTRDLQRNIDLMKEFEQESTTVNFDAAAPINHDMEGHSRQSDYGKSFEVVNDFNSDIENELKSETCLEISFDDDGKQKSLDGDDDEFFAHLVAGDQVTSCSANNATSDCEWEDGMISRESGSLVNGDIFGTYSFGAQDGNDNESDVEWEDGTGLNNDCCNMKSIDVEDGNDRDIGLERQEHLTVTDIHEDARLLSADVQKTVSKGSAEEEAALQEAIRRSIVDKRDGITSCVSHDLKASDYASTRQQQLESYSPLPRSHLERVLDDDQQSQLFVNECDQSSIMAGKDTYAPSSPVMHSASAASDSAGPVCYIDSKKDVTEQQLNTYTENALISNLAKTGSSVPADMAAASLPGTLSGDLIEDMKKDRAAPTYKSGVVYECSIGHTFSALEEQTLHSNLKKTVGEDDTRPDSFQERSHAVEETSFSKDENTAETLGSSLEDELLVLDQEYNNIGDEQRKHERNADCVNAEMFVECQELLQMFGLPYIIAPMEAEAQCAYMELANLVDGVVTDDSDVFLFGAQSVYKNIFDDRKYVETYLMKDIESELGLNREKIIRMALLLGSDYTEGVSGIGIVNAIEVVNAFPEEDGLHKFREWIESPDPAILGKVGAEPGLSSKKKGSKASKNGKSNLKNDLEGNPAADSNTVLEHENNEAKNGIEKIKQSFMNKHRNVSKNWHIPGSFPSDAVISAYEAPQVDKSTEPLGWGKPDVFSLRRLCWEKFGWNGQKADELLLPVLKEYNKHETQLRLEAFYTFNERFAKFSSKRIKQAVKGITGKKSVNLDKADVSQEDLTKMDKTRAHGSGNRGKRSLAKRKDHAGEKKNPSKKIRSQREEDPVEGLSVELGSSKLCTEAEKQSLSDAGSSRVRGRRRRAAVGRCRQKENSDSEHDETNVRDYNSGYEFEHKGLAESIQLPDSVRRSKRARKATNYLEQDEEDLVIPVNRRNKHHSDDREGEQIPSHCLGLDEADMANVNGERKGTSEDLPGHGLPGDYLEKGGGFCAEEDEAETESNQLSSIQGDTATLDANSEYLQMGGGFCVDDEDDLDIRECGGEASNVTDAYVSTLTETEEAGLTIDPHDIVTAPASVSDTVQVVQKDLLSDTKRSLGDQHESAGSSLSNAPQTIKSIAPTTVNPFSAIPYLKRKKRKS